MTYETGKGKTFNVQRSTFNAQRDNRERGSGFLSGINPYVELLHTKVDDASELLANRGRQH